MRLKIQNRALYVELKPMYVTFTVNSARHPYGT